ncbi:MAG: U32 family peptidase [Erysipelotrichaceae bacterium]|nr:U32 family peptidase [Erysipelotrichaceae bacterium]
MKKCELLAPAKDLHKAKTAIRYGADAVYIGGKEYSLRARASNFEREDIAEAVAFAHEHNARLYVTVNIVFHDEDLYGIKEYLQYLESIGVDAVIIESPGLVRIVKKYAPKLECHISTQLSSLNSASADLLKSWGADRVVLGRELSIREISQVAANTDLPLEVFIHGGMCANYSGRCTLSNYMTLRDANRGGCAQSCRWHYRIYKDGEELSDPEHTFSMGSRDLQAAAFLKDMHRLGIASLKIEGRMKSDYYIATVVRAYQTILDKLDAGEEIGEEDLAFFGNELNKAENRPFACGFLDGVMDESKQLYEETANVRHDYVGYVREYDPYNGLARIETRNPFAVGDTLEVFGPHKENRRFVLTDMFNEDWELVEESHTPMRTLWLMVPFETEEHDMVRLVK